MSTLMPDNPAAPTPPDSASTTTLHRLIERLAYLDRLIGEHHSASVLREEHASCPVCMAAGGPDFFLATSMLLREARASAAALRSSAAAATPDANCFTLPNGECASDKPCMHSVPARSSAAGGPEADELDEPHEIPAIEALRAAASDILYHANGGKVARATFRAHCVALDAVAADVITLTASIGELRARLTAVEADRRAAEQPVRVWPENFWRELWHENCPNRGMMRHGMPGRFTLADGSVLKEYECLMCGARCFAGVDARSRIVTRPFSLEALVRGREAPTPSEPAPAAGGEHG